MSNNFTVKDMQLYCFMLRDNDVVCNHQAIMMHYEYKDSLNLFYMPNLITYERILFTIRLANVNLYKSYEDIL